MYYFRNLFRTLLVDVNNVLSLVQSIKACNTVVFCFLYYSVQYWSVKCTFYVGRIVNKSMASTSVYNIHIAFFGIKMLNHDVRSEYSSQEKNCFCLFFIFYLSWPIGSCEVLSVSLYMLSSVNFCTLIFFSETTKPIETKLCRNVHWVGLYNMLFFLQSMTNFIT